MSTTINTDLQNEALALASRQNALARNHGDDAKSLDCLVDGTTVQKLAPNYQLSSPYADTGLGSVQYKHHTVQGQTSSAFNGQAILSIPSPRYVYGISVALWIVGIVGVRPGNPGSLAGGVVHFWLDPNAALGDGDRVYYPYLMSCVLGSGESNFSGAAVPFQGAMPVSARTVWFPRGLDQSYDLGPLPSSCHLNMRYEMGYLGYRVTLYHS